MVGRTLLSAVLSCALVITPVSIGWAAPSQQDIVAAQQALKEGIAAEKKSDWKAARDAFQRAVDKNDTADGRLHLARAESHLGHLTEANDSYKLVLENKAAPAPTKAAAKKEQQSVAERIPKITVKVPPGFAGSVRIDKLELASSEWGQAIEVNPGTRTVIAEAEGFENFTKSLVLTDRANETVEIKMVASKKAADPNAVKVDTNDGSTRKTLGYVSLGVGGAGLILGTAFGLASRSTRNELKAACTANVCSDSQRDTYDRGKMQADVATVGFIVAGVGVGVGVVLLLTAPSKKETDKDKEPEKASLTPYVGPMSLGMYGRF
ncbi:MAG: tetratricopeptide repeat protein [Deltaproteobacteria bacterium]|nr:tetratricopeptide repeat protein [Deltaproteobacteria bacterium]